MNAILCSTIFALGFFSFIVIKRVRRLAHVPGPWLCLITDLWRAYHQNRCSVTDLLAALHDQYGPVVKIGPNTVSISKASAIPQIYTMHGEYRKADSYSCLRTVANGVVYDSVVDVQNETYSSMLKRAFGAAFSVKNLRDYEALVDQSAASTRKRLGQHGTVELFETLRRFQIDFLMKAAFSQDMSFFETNADIGSYSFHPRLLHWNRWQSMAKIEYVLNKSRIVNRIRSLFCAPAVPFLGALTNDLLQRRLRHETSSKEYKDLLDKWLDAQKKHSENIDIGTVRRMVASTVNAGFDTTAIIMTAMLYYLMQTPPAMAELRREIEQARSSGLLSDPPEWLEVNKLLYLDAVFKEVMRMYPPLQLPLERTIPDGGAEICGIRLPASTVVGCSAGITSRDTAIFGADSRTFRPERWLEADASQRISMERCSLGFGSGKRGCIGRHIAELEIKKLIPSILLDFEVAFQDKNAKLRSVDGLTPFPAPIMATFRQRKLKEYLA